jgi:hypothetical protein
MRKLLPISTLAAFLATSCTSVHTANHPPTLPITYHNAQCDLTFHLPSTWQAYSVRLEKWDVLPPDGTGVATRSGPIIVIRHPHWTAETPHQDIPIMVFTRSEWDRVSQGTYFPYACGLIDELWHTPTYVFGLWTRYQDLDIQRNHGEEVQGAQEAADIIQRNRLANKMPQLYPH